MKFIRWNFQPTKYSIKPKYVYNVTPSKVFLWFYYTIYERQQIFPYFPNFPLSEIQIDVPIIYRTANKYAGQLDLFLDCLLQWKATVERRIWSKLMYRLVNYTYVRIRLSKLCGTVLSIVLVSTSMLLCIERYFTRKGKPNQRIKLYRIKSTMRRSVRLNFLYSAAKFSSKLYSRRCIISKYWMGEGALLDKGVE